MLIEDDEDDRDFFISALDKINPLYNCLTAIHGEDALRLREQPEYDFIFWTLICLVWMEEPVC